MEDTPSQDFPAETLDAGEAEHLQRFEGRFTVFIAIPVTLGLSVAFTWLLSEVAHRYWWNWPDAVAVILPTIAIWILPGVMAAALCMTVAMYFGWLVATGSQFQLWMRSQGLTPGSLIQAGFVLGLLWVWLTAAALGYSTRLTQQEFIINEYWSVFEWHYNMQEVQQIFDRSFIHPKASQPGGRVPAYEVRFKDGTSWHSQFLFRDINPGSTAAAKQLVEKLSQQSGRPIEK